MRLLAMREPRHRRRHGEALASLMGGVPSLTIGLLAIVLIASYMLHEPVGPPGFYRVEWFPASRPSVRGGTWPVPSVSLVLPSATMFGMLAAGLWSGGLGIYAAGGHRQAPGFHVDRRHDRLRRGLYPSTNLDRGGGHLLNRSTQGADRGPAALGWPGGSRGRLPHIADRGVPFRSERRTSCRPLLRGPGGPNGDAPAAALAVAVKGRAHPPIGTSLDAFLDLDVAVGLDLDFLVDHAWRCGAQRVPPDDAGGVGTRRGRASCTAVPRRSATRRPRRRAAGPPEARRCRRQSAARS